MVQVSRTNRTDNNMGANVTHENLDEQIIALIEKLKFYEIYEDWQVWHTDAYIYTADMDLADKPLQTKIEVCVSMQHYLLYRDLRNIKVYRYSPGGKKHERKNQ